MHRHLEALSALLIDLLRRHWVSATFLLLTSLTLLIIALLRWWIRRRWQRLLEAESEEPHELDLLPSLGPKDQAALQVIKDYRREVWDIPETELQLTVEALSKRAMAIVRSIAAVYHSECDVPEYEATLLESLHLIQRVSRRISHLANVLPWRLLGNRKLSEYQRYYQIYRKINDSALLQILKRHRNLYRIARLAVNVKNLGNPFYWAGKELSREGYFITLRWFTLAFTSQVGREAMKLYSGRHFQREEERDATLVCHRLFALCRKWEGPLPSEWLVLVDVVTGHAYLEPDVKLHILSRWAQQRLPKELDQQTFQTQIARDWYRRGLKDLLKSEPDISPAKRTCIEQELSRLDVASDSRGNEP
jgi:hypothetical protein